MEQGASQKEMQVPVNTLSEEMTVEQDISGSQQENDQLSAYDRVMARSRMQGEGLNKLFGTMMAKRAGHSQEVNQVEPEASNSAIMIEEGEASSNASIQLNPQVNERNAWIENAWDQRLKEMGHGSGSRNTEKGKARDSVQEALNLGDESLKSKSDPLQEKEDSILSQHDLAKQSSSLFTPISGIPPNFSHSVPNSRPGSTSGFSFSGKTSKLNFARLIGKGNRKRQNNSFAFASQPPSLYSSGTITPDESATVDASKIRRRRKAFSLRSLSDAILKDKRVDQTLDSKDASRSASIAGVNITEEILAGEATINEESRSQSSGGEADASSKQEKMVVTSPQKQYEEQSRPTLLRASHSVPLSSTAVNLSSIDGITLHISSVAASSFVQPEPGEPIIKSDLFDLMLPREIRIKCFRWLVKIHEEEERGIYSKMEWKSQAAVRELLCLSRVSKTWQSLLLDGQLWSSVDSYLLNNISKAGLLRLTRAAGPFIKRLDLHHASHISSNLLINLMSVPEEFKKDEIQRFNKSMMSIPTLSNIKTVQFASLSTLNISGCREISTTSLHGTLVRLPSLSNLDISNIDIVCNETCLILGSSHPNLKSLNISRCFNVTGKGILAFIQAAQGALYDKALFSNTTEVTEREEDIVLSLQKLRASNCSDINATVMAAMGNALKALQILDLSYSSDLNDAAIEAFVTHPGPISFSQFENLKSKTSYRNILEIERTVNFSPFVTLTPRQAGGDIQSDEVHYRRLFPLLRHICLSSCRSLTDRSCIYLAHAVPNLQYLELANIGVNLREDGVVKLIETIPQIKKLDLEGASELGECVLDALTPDAAYAEALGLEVTRRGRRLSRRRFRQGDNESRSLEKKRSLKGRKPSPPGAHLTHLILSHVSKPSQESLLLLIRRCPRLIHLQLDDTKANDAILKEFVTFCRQRESSNAYISLVDCRALSRTANADVISQSSTRPREGKRGGQYSVLDYSDGSMTSGKSIGDHHNHHYHHTPIDECNNRLIVVKTFFNWEIRSQQRRIQQRRNQKAFLAANNANGSNSGRFLNRGRRDSLGAALAFIGGGSSNSQSDDEMGGPGRWGRIAGGLMGVQGDEGEDSRGCTIM